MPQIHRRGSQLPRSRSNAINYYRPARNRRPSAFKGFVQTIQRLPRRFLVIVGCAVILLAGAITAICLLPGGSGAAGNLAGTAKPGAPKPTPTATDPTVTLPPRAAPLAEPLVTPEPATARDVSFGSKGLKFTEKQINCPALYGNELIFSAGTGSLDSGAVLKKIYLYNLETGEETKIADTKVSYGEFYETLVTPQWMVWLETDHHTINQIYVLNRATNEKFKVKDCKNGKPKLKLYNNTLIWMEQVDKNTDSLYMFDLEEQDSMALFSSADVATYGVSAPCIYNDTVVWAAPDPGQTPEQIEAQGEKSAIYWVNLNEDAIVSENDTNTLKTQVFLTGTYVHEPVYNGKYFVWVDGNYSPNSRLYISEPNGTPKVIAENITTYNLGDGVVVYGKNAKVWAYVIDTGETCLLTGGSEQGYLPIVSGRTVVWTDITDDTDRDTLRYKVLTDEELGLGAS